MFTLLAVAIISRVLIKHAACMQWSNQEIGAYYFLLVELLLIQELGGRNSVLQTVFSYVGFQRMQMVSFVRFRSYCCFVFPMDHYSSWDIEGR